MKNYYIIGSLFCLLKISNPVYSQTGTGADVVYAGRSFTWGMNMGSYDMCILLRADGTFCEQLEETDWQTRITGRYRKIKQGIYLEYLDKSVTNDTIEFDKDDEGFETIYYGGAQMVKMLIPNKIPAGYYRYSSASSSGGVGTGIIYVGTSQYEGYNFYENGTFDRNSSGGVMVSGENIGGGSTSESSDKGKYTIKNGLLTLTHNDGTTNTHSFFYDDNGEKEFMVAIDGSIFFYGDEEDFDAQTLDSNSDFQQKNKPSETLKMHGLGILDKIKHTHGGAALDIIKTARANFTTLGIRFQILVDFKKRMLRLESLDPSFIYIEQIQANEGWVYQNNQLQSLSLERIEELQLSFIGGVFGLQNSVMERTNIMDIRETDDGILLMTVEIDGHTLGYIINKEDEVLMGNFMLKNGENEITYYNNLKKQNDLLIPFKETTETSNGTVEISYENFKINSVIGATEWAKPN